MNHQSKSSRRDPLPGHPSPVGTASSRRRFLKQTLAAGMAGAGISRADGQTTAERVKSHKSPRIKKDHAKQLPKDLKEAMEWDFERFLSEVVEQIRTGKSTKQIEDWIHPKDSKVANRQKVKVAVEGDEASEEKDHALGVCLVAPIEWKMDGDEITGFVIRGRMGRQLTGEPLECEDYGTDEKAAAGRAPAAQALVISGRRPRFVPDLMPVAVPGGSSSSSSSSSSSWPKP